MKAAVLRGWVYTVILLTILGGSQRYVCAQAIKDPGGADASFASFAAAMTKMSSAQAMAGGIGGEFPSLLGLDPSMLFGSDLSLAMGLNTMLSPFISPSSLGGNTLMSAAILSQSQSMLGVTPVGGGIVGTAPMSPIGSTPGGDASLLMNFFGLGGGILPGASGALNNISFPLQPSLPLPFLSSQGRGIYPLGGLASTLMTSPFNPLGLSNSLLSSLQMGGYQYGNSPSGPILGGMLGINSMPGGGYTYPLFGNSLTLPGGSYLPTMPSSTGNNAAWPLRLPDSFNPNGLLSLQPSSLDLYSGYGGFYGGSYGGATSGGFYPTILNSARPSIAMIVWPAVIFGVVKDQEGRGLESAVIDIAYSGQRVAQLISRLPDGDYGLSPSFLGEESSLTISYGHRYTFYETFYVVGPTQCDFIMIPGTVRDEITGIPLGRVEVLATSLDSPYLQATTTTDPDGTYQLFLPVIRTAGDRRDYKDYTITARLPLSSGSNTNHTATPVRVPSEGSKQLNFALNLPQFSGKVVDILNHSPLKGAEIKISPAPSTVILPIANTIESGPEGNFHVPLPLGTYTLEVTKSKYQPKTVTLQFYATMENYLIELTREEDRPRPQNTRPVITSPQDGQEITVNAGKELRFSVVAQDAENPYLFYTIQGGAKDWPQIPPEDPEGGSAGIPKEYHHLTSLADLGEYTLKITVSDLDLVTSVHIKVKVQYPLQLRLTRGLNLISYPAGPEGSIDSAFDLLSLLGDANKVESISRYDTIQGKYISAGYTQDGKKRGSDFPISSQEGYTVYAKQPVTVNLKIQRANLTSCTLNLKQGTNLVGIPVVMGDRYSSHDLLLDLGPNTAGSLYHYNPAKGACEFTYWIGNHPGGEDFPIQMGEGYFIEAITDKQLSLPLLR